jgi:uncharacterized spore protein YtfJ
MLVQHLLQAIAERLHSSSSMHTIYGDPIEAQGKTLIPVAKVSYGFGGGAIGTNSLDCADAQPSGNGVEGGGGGGGIRMVPLGMVEVTPQQTRFLPFGSGRRMLGALAIGLVVGLLMGRRYYRKALS